MAKQTKKIARDPIIAEIRAIRKKMAEDFPTFEDYARHSKKWMRAWVKQGNKIGIPSRKRAKLRKAG